MTSASSMTFILVKVVVGATAADEQSAVDLTSTVAATLTTTATRTTTSSIVTTIIAAAVVAAATTTTAAEKEATAAKRTPAIITMLHGTYFWPLSVPGYEDVTRSEWEEMLENVPLYDPAQAEIAAILTNRFFFPDDPADLMDDDDDSAANGTHSPIWKGPKYPRTPQQQEDYDRQMQSVRTVEKLVSLRALLPIVRPKDIRRTFVSHKI